MANKFHTFRALIIYVNSSIRKNDFSLLNIYLQNFTLCSHSQNALFIFNLFKTPFVQSTDQITANQIYNSSVIRSTIKRNFMNNLILQMRCDVMAMNKEPKHRTSIEWSFQSIHL